MTLKILLNNKKIEQERTKLKEVDEKILNLQQRSEDLEKSLTEEITDEELAVVEEEVEKIEKELKEKKEEKQTLEENIAAIEKETEELRNKKPKTEVRKMTNNIEEREAVEKYIRSKGLERAGVKTSDIGALIPKDIEYKPQEETSTVFDLSTLVTKVKVSTGAGQYPVLSRATAKLATVEELAKNPELAKPEFIDVSWKVDTYRAAIPLSEEAIQDSEVDVLGIIQKNALEQKVNTTNEKISEVLKSFTEKQVTTVDDLKKIINVDLDPAYKREFVVSQSFFQVLDTLKDKNGRYILNEALGGSQQATVFGYPLVVVNDTLLGSQGEAKAFIGDLEKAVLFADRAEIAARWVDNEIYGQLLQVVMRFGVKKIDDKAGFFVTLNIAQA